MFRDPITYLFLMVVGAGAYFLVMKSGLDFNDLGFEVSTKAHDFKDLLIGYAIFG